MNKKLLLLLVTILMGSMTTVNAKINYIPLYIVDTQPDVKVVKHVPAAPLFITQDGYKLILPGFEDSLTLVVYKGIQEVFLYALQRQQSIVELPTTLVGDFEIRICTDTYYYFGYITLEGQNGANTPSETEKPEIPTETEHWGNITLYGNNTTQEALLNSLMGLNIVEYNRKDGDSEQRYVGMLADELKTAIPQVTDDKGGIILGGINIYCFFSLMTSCIQELKNQLDSRTETLFDIMMSREITPTAYNSARAAIGNTLLSVSPTSVNESAQVRYILNDDASNAYILISDMGGRTMTKKPVSPSETNATINSGVLGEGIFLCTLFVNGQNVGTKRLIKTR